MFNIYISYIYTHINTYRFIISYNFICLYVKILSALLLSSAEVRCGWGGIPASALLCPTRPLAEMHSPPAIVLGCQHRFFLLLRCLCLPHRGGTEGPMSPSAAIIFHHHFGHLFGPPSLKYLQLPGDLSRGLSTDKGIIKTCVPPTSQARCHRGEQKGGFVSLHPWIPKDKGGLHIFLTLSDPHLGMRRSQRNGGGQGPKYLRSLLPPNYLPFQGESAWREG